VNTQDEQGGSSACETTIWQLAFPSATPLRVAIEAKVARSKAHVRHMNSAEHPERDTGDSGHHQHSAHATSRALSARCFQKWPLEFMAVGPLGLVCARWLCPMPSQTQGRLLRAVWVPLSDLVGLFSGGLWAYNGD